MNKGKWGGSAEFPGLAELAPALRPENILTMDQDFYREKVQPKFFYLSPDELWKWQVDVLCFMGNHYQESYKPYIMDACQSENEKVREMASLLYSELQNRGI